MRKKTTLLFSVLLMLLTSFKPTADSEFVYAKDLIEKFEFYIGKTILTEGKIDHFCGINNQKMRLSVEEVGYIMIVPKDPDTLFDGSFNRKTVRVEGIVKEVRISKDQIDEMEKTFGIPCSIDNLPCINTSYTERKKEEGTLETTSQKGIENLRETLEKTGKNYILVVTIEAKNVRVIEE